MRGCRRGSRALLVGALIACALVAAGCETLNGAQRVVDRGNLAGDLAVRLGRIDGVSYTADYQLAGGAQATIVKAKDPNRVAYTYPDGKLIITPQTYTDCRALPTTMKCTVSGVPSPDPGPAADLLGELTNHGMITPPVVVNLLNATALDTDAEIQQHDSTIAGQHATCVTVAAVDNASASSFEACVTTDGVLGSFAGVVNGNRIELALIQYRGTVDADAFDSPAGAALTDQRLAHS